MKTLKRRRREHKTDYGKRLKLLKSGKPRVVFRRTNRYLIVQYVESKEAKDKVVLGVNSKDLLKYGWPENAKGSLKSTAASYLTGHLIGKQIKDKKLDTPIVDMGMLRMVQKGKQYAFLKGLIDSGVDVKCPENAFPSEERIKGEHMKNKVDVDTIKEKIGK
ncbi:50S ribosomal protein L18 [Candidatus Pacearchaeota archaeon]|nr:50S ribosomal protein L18 [Candidatus Pacearchaeota archaeon]